MDDVEVRHGYSLAHLSSLARLAGKRAFGRTILDPLERTDIAWCGLVEHLYAADERPTPRELIRAGGNAVTQWSAAEQYTHGHRHGGKVVSHPRFWAYWWRQASPSPERGVVERVAMLQIWPTLKPNQQEALLALAVYEDYAAAAEALGVTLKAFYARVERARRQFFLAWHEGETPPARLRLDRRPRAAASG